MKKNILIVDDEADIRELIELALLRTGHNLDSAKDLASAYELLKTKQYQLCLTDMRLPDGDGLELIKYITEHAKGTDVAMITAYGDMQTAIDAMKLGAFDFINKPLDINDLRSLVKDALAESPPTALATTIDEPYKLIGTSVAMQDLQHLIAKVAKSQAPVYILGESGTGKELVARNIHLQSSRHRGNFVAINCSAIPTELMESEFFGHQKGSFTGAHQDHKGLFEQADGGTLFLDEVADLALPMQAKLLRAIQERKIKPVGAHTEKSVNVRLLSASHKSLDKLVAEDKFREDLYYRLNVIEIKTPPLRERKDDIPLIAKAFLTKISKREQLQTALEIEKPALEVLQQQNFAGNVRELENMLERAAALCDDGLIRAADLNLSLAAAPSLPVKKATLPIEDLETALEQSERAKIMAALEQTRWNKTEAAKLLGLTFRQLRYRIKKFDIN